MKGERTGAILPQAFMNIFKKPATVAYPVDRGQVFTNIRGKLLFDEEKCVGCRLCVRDCPAHAIRIDEVGEKKYKAVLQMDRCIFCGQCADSCHKGAIECTPEFELAGFSRGDMETDIGSNKIQSQPQ